MRGIEGRDLFLEKADRRDFLQRLAEVLPDTGVQCYAWALMDNHVHLVVRTGRIPLWRAMKRINTGYAVRFNRRYERKGYLFQDRFRSRPVHSDDGLRIVIRYVHRNPLEAGLVRSLHALSRYPWTGHPTLLGRIGPRPFESPSATLALFGACERSARVSLQQWMRRSEVEELEPAETPPDGSPGADRGDTVERHESDRPLPFVLPGVELEPLMRRVCRRLDVQVDALRSSSRNPRVLRARAIFAFVAIRYGSVAGTAVAAALRVHPSTISRARRDGDRELAKAGGSELIQFLLERR
jgi:REP element-mobilizing transposase RayT